MDLFKVAFLEGKKGEANKSLHKNRGENRCESGMIRFHLIGKTHLFTVVKQMMTPNSFLAKNSWTSTSTVSIHLKLPCFGVPSYEISWEENS